MDGRIYIERVLKSIDAVADISYNDAEEMGHFWNVGDE